MTSGRQAFGSSTRLRWVVLLSWALAGSTFKCPVPDKALDSEFAVSPLFPSSSGEWSPSGYNPNTWTLGLTKVQVIEMCSSGGSCPDFDYAAFFKEESEFYRQSSGGEQLLEFSLTSWRDTPFYTQASCERGAVNCFGGSIFENTIDKYEKARGLSGFDRYIFILKSGCRCLGWSGLGQVNGPVSWMNGVPTLRTVTHELGHNNGALHANVHQREYANQLSVMGASNLVSDFTAVGKVAMKWLKSSHVRSFGRNPTQCSSHHPPCRQTCTPQNPCTVDLHAHDSCRGDEPVGCRFGEHTYAIRVDTPSPHGMAASPVESLWIEFRTALPPGFEDLQNGVQLVWATTNGVNTLYGPTQYFDYASTTETLRDAHLRLNRYFVYDLDNVGAVVKVQAVHREGPQTDHFAQVQLYFAQNTGLEFDYSRFGSLITTNNNADSHLYCGDVSRELHVGTDKAFEIFHLFAWREANVLINVSKSSCVGIRELDELAGLYVYGTYPLAYELDSDVDPRAGALAFIPFSCTEGFTASATAVLNRIVPVSTNPNSPSYRDFSQSNYVAVYKGSMTGNVMLKVSINESYGCFTECRIAQVSNAAAGSSGNYTILSEQYDDYPAFAKGEYRLEVANGVWSLRQGAQVLYSQDPAIPTPLFPQIVTGLLGEVVVTCVAKLGLSNQETTAPTVDQTTSKPTTMSPTLEPTKEPTVAPSREPTRIPTSPPTLSPTLEPPTPIPTITTPTLPPSNSNAPTTAPTRFPVPPPTQTPQPNPTEAPMLTPNPSRPPSAVPTLTPISKSPTVLPPTLTPSRLPTPFAKTTNPTTKHPTSNPTNYPTEFPTTFPTNFPRETAMPSSPPTDTRSMNPTSVPSAAAGPTSGPVEGSSPTVLPSVAPTPDVGLVPSNFTAEQISIDDGRSQVIVAGSCLIGLTFLLGVFGAIRRRRRSPDADGRLDSTRLGFLFSPAKSTRASNLVQPLGLSVVGEEVATSANIAPLEMKPESVSQGRDEVAIQVQWAATAPTALPKVKLEEGLSRTNVKPQTKPHKRNHIPAVQAREVDRKKRDGAFDVHTSTPEPAWKEHGRVESEAKRKPTLTAGTVIAPKPKSKPQLDKTPEAPPRSFSSYRSPIGQGVSYPGTSTGGASKVNLNEQRFVEKHAARTVVTTQVVKDERVVCSLCAEKLRAYLKWSIAPLENAVGYVAYPDSAYVPKYKLRASYEESLGHLGALGSKRMMEAIIKLFRHGHQSKCILVMRKVVFSSFKVYTMTSRNVITELAFDEEVDCHQCSAVVIVPRSLAVLDGVVIYSKQAFLHVGRLHGVGENLYMP